MKGSHASCPNEEDVSLQLPKTTNVSRKRRKEQYYPSNVPHEYRGEVILPQLQVQNNGCKVC